MNAVTKQEIVSLIEGLIESDACMGSLSDKQVIMSLELVSRIKQHGIAPPDGWVLVPKEPTDDMAHAAVPHIDEEPEYYYKWHTAKDVYKAMLAAAPEVSK